MANIKISKNEEKFIKAMDSIALKTTKNQEEISRAINSNFIKIIENEGKFINAMNNHASSVNRLSAKYSDLFKTVDAVYKIINAEAGKVHAFNRAIKTFLEEWSKIDLVAITNNWSKILQQFIDDYNQVVESVEEDKWHDYYHLKTEHSTHVEKHLPYVTDDFKYFLKFYVPYYIRFLGLNKHNHREKKYELHLFDLNLFHQYMNVLTNEGGSEEEALAIVWNKHDKRNTNKINILPPPTTPILESNISAPKNKEKSTIEKFDSIPKHIKTLFSIYQSELERLGNDRQKALDSISIKTFEDKERIKYRGTILKNVKDRIRNDFQKYNLIPKK